MKTIIFNYVFAVFDFLFLFYCNVGAFFFFFLAIIFVFYKKKVTVGIDDKIFVNFYKVNRNFLFFILCMFFYFLFFWNNNFRFSFLWFDRNILFIKYLFNMSFSFDVINVYFILLSLFIFIIIFLSNNNFSYIFDVNYKNSKIVIYLFFVVEFFILLTFSTSNIFFFFFFFECSLIPIYVLMLLLGKGSKKKHYACLSLVFFTLTGSVFLLFSILYMFVITGSIDFKNLNYEIIDFNSQCVLFLFFVAGFSVKIPIFPFYSWLPEAHVEASTSISIILAAIFLKVATYGLLKIVVFNMFLTINYFYSLIFYFSIISVLFACLLSLIQTDLKKIVALSSIVHMNYIVIGIFSLDPKSIVGSFIYMFSHALVSTGLFYLIGLIYENTGSRDLLNFSNFLKYSQSFFFCFFFFNLSNLSFPLTFSFISELMVLNNLIYLNIVIIFVFLFSIFISVIYSFWIIHNIFFSKNFSIKNIVLFNIFDFFIVFLLVFLLVFLGFMPFIIFFNLEQEIYLILINKFNIY